jgi:hypothetical protein
MELHISFKRGGSSLSQHSLLNPFYSFLVNLAKQMNKQTSFLDPEYFKYLSKASVNFSKFSQSEQKLKEKVDVP